MCPSSPTARSFLMHEESASQTDVPQEEDDDHQEHADGEDAAGETVPTAKSGAKKKRTWQKVGKLTDFYEPAPYSLSKGRGTGKGMAKGNGKGMAEEGLKGKGKVGFLDGQLSKPEDEFGRMNPMMDGQSIDGDGMPCKAVNGKKKQGPARGREVKGKGKITGLRKGKGRFSSMDFDGDSDGGGSRSLGPQGRSQMVGKSCGPQGPGTMACGAPYGAIPAMPYAFGAAVPYSYGGVPAMYALPYYVMPQGPMTNSATNFCPAGGSAASLPPPQVQAQTPQTSSERSNLKNQVQSQLEYYFDEENLIKDTYLREHMNQEGWVPIMLLANFRRIMSMTKDMSLIVDSIESSQKVEIDTQGTKLRLKHDWQKWVMPANPVNGTGMIPCNGAGFGPWAGSGAHMPNSDVPPNQGAC